MNVHSKHWNNKKNNPLLQSILLIFCFISPVWAKLPYFFNAESDSKIKNTVLEYVSSVSCDCVIAIGRTGLIKALNETSTSTIFTINISAASFLEIKNENLTRNITAIYSDPDPTKLIQLGLAIYGKNSLAIFYSDRTSYIKDKIPHVRFIKTNKRNIRNSLNSPMIADIKSIIVIPDANIWNRETFKMAVDTLL